MDEIANELRRFLLAEFLPGESAANLRDDTPLRTGGILDSVSTLKFVAFVEQRFGIEIEAHETGVRDFDCIADVAALVQRKRGR